ncbi:hypothetical protein IV500_05215 [Paeniglutamicibacter antarcticus]|uniref:Uncharacterized protein n=1 Tax=Arthrobacter terrae TaxID=2935737 RepID=A0A931CPW6_9MICC|nr:hypothetical protein [Arthrobacter terrae]MBG0738819.1 hypothetical protein [Arthrobacter terrae]
MLHRMAGNRNRNEVDAVMAAATDDDKLDAAIHGVTPADSIAFQLCRNLLATQRSS